jgi:dTMP kinase
MRGLFITLEGPEGSGKSTQVKMLQSKLEKAGRKVVCFRHLGSSKVGEDIRGILLNNKSGEAPCPRSEMLLFHAATDQLVEKEVQPYLDKGYVVICDRFFDSTTAYQGYGRGMDCRQVWEIGYFAAGGLVPDMTLLLDLPPAVGFARITGKLDRMERESMEFHRKVREGYLKLAEADPKRFITINAMRDKDFIAEAIWQEVEAAL